MLRAQVIGNLGRDVVLREVNGKFAMNFAVAHNDRLIDGDGVVTDRTTWVNCTRWSTRKPEVARYLKKGTLVHIAGTPEVKIYRDKTGVNKVDFRLKVESLELLSSGTGKKEDEKSAEELEAERIAREEAKDREVQEAFAD